MFWLVVGIIAGLLIAVTMQPKIPGMKPPGINEIQLPTINEGREKPVLFGTRDLKAPLIHWWGLFSVLAIKSKSSKK
jgi:hypothetical protein